MTLLYMDSSALVKRYVVEDESPAVLERMDEAPIVGTSSITRVEVPAALKKAVRTGALRPHEGEEANQAFREDWLDVTRISVTDMLEARAGDLAWLHDLRAYDAVQLAAALTWRDERADTDDAFAFACYDIDLRRAARAEGLGTWPD